MFGKIITRGRNSGLKRVSTGSLPPSLPFPCYFFPQTESLFTGYKKSNRFNLVPGLFLTEPSERGCNRSRSSSETQGQIVEARESLNRRENMAQKKSEERPEEPLGTMSYQTSSKRSPPFWLLYWCQKTCVFLAPIRSQKDGDRLELVW